MNIKQYGDWAFITGASSGIGKAFALECAKQDINCILVSNNETALIQTQLALNKINSTIQSIYFNVDLSDREQLTKLLQQPELKKVGLVINCAAFGAMGLAISRPTELYHKMLDVNAHALMAISLFFADLFVREQRKGGIINVTTANCELYRPIPFCAVYTSSKYFSKFFTEALAYELKNKKIDLLNVACGPTDTNFQEVAGTQKLSWCESAQSVALKAFNALGQKKTIITHPRSKLLITLIRYLPLTRELKIKIISQFYKEKLAGIK